MCLEKHAPPTREKSKRINKTIDSKHANRNEHVNINETLPSATEDNVNDSDVFFPTRANTTTHGTAQPSLGWLDHGNVADDSGLRTNLIPSFRNLQYGAMAQQGSLQQSQASGSLLQPGCVVQAQQGSLQQSLALSSSLQTGVVAQGSLQQNLAPSSVLQMEGVAHAQLGSHQPSLASVSVLQPVGMAQVQQQHK